MSEIQQTDTLPKNLRWKNNPKKYKRAMERIAKKKRKYWRKILDERNKRPPTSKPRLIRIK